MLESTVEKHFVKVSTEHRVWVIKIWPFGIKGFPDRLCLGDNTDIFFVELKRPKKRVERTKQHFMHRQLRKRGFKVYVFNTKQEIDTFYQAREVQA